MIKLNEKLEVGEVDSNEVQIPALMLSLTVDVETLNLLSDPEASDSAKISFVDTLLSLLNS
jgi:hypothetical protein